MEEESNQEFLSNNGDHLVQLTSAQVAELVKTLDHTRNILGSLIKPAELPKPSRVTPRVKSWWGRHCFPSKRRWVYHNITLITVILQFLNLMTLTMIDVMPRHNIAEYKLLLSSSVIMIVLQVLNLFILVLATGRLAKQVLHHAVNSFFLAQSYLASLLLFAGLYTLTYRLNKHSWKFLNEELGSDPIQVFQLYAKFLFYSISTATLCGSDNALPVDWYNHLFAGTQMLLSFCYFASILGMALSPSQPQPPQQHQQHQAGHNTLRRQSSAQSSSGCHRPLLSPIESSVQETGTLIEDTLPPSSSQSQLEKKQHRQVPHYQYHTQPHLQHHGHHQRLQQQQKQQQQRSQTFPHIQQNHIQYGVRGKSAGAAENSDDDNDDDDDLLVDGVSSCPNIQYNYSIVTIESDSGYHGS